MNIFAQCGTDVECCETKKHSINTIRTANEGTTLVLVPHRSVENYILISLIRQLLLSFSREKKKGVKNIVVLPYLRLLLLLITLTRLLIKIENYI